MRALFSSFTILLATASAALADPVQTTPMDASAREAGLVHSFLGEGAYHTAFVDIDRTGSEEVLVRVGEDCSSGVACRTLLLRQGRQDWEIVLDRVAETIEIGTATGFGGVHDVVLDGVQTWRWSSGGYRIDVGRSGAPVDFSLVPSDYVSLLVAEFGPSAPALFQALDAVTLRYAVVDLTGEGGTDLVVRLDGPGVCGRVMGCPIRVLRVAGDRYETLLEGFSSDSVVITDVFREGARDVLASLPGGGFVVYGWTGEEYVQADMVAGE